MLLILVVLLILLLLGGGGAVYGRRAGWRARSYGGGLIALLIFVVLIVWVMIRLTETPVPMPAGVPPIERR